MNYKIGDRVEAVCDIDEGDFQTKGKKGRVISIGSNLLAGNVGVEFDDEVDGAHNCDGKGKHCHCLWCAIDEIRPEQPFTGCVACSDPTPLPEGREICWACENSMKCGGQP